MKIAIYHVNCSLIHFMACHFGSQLNFFNMHNMFLDFYQQFFFSYFWCDVHFCSTWPPSLERSIYLLICVHVSPNVYNCFRNCRYSYNLVNTPFSGNKDKYIIKIYCIVLNLLFLKTKRCIRNHNKYKKSFTSAYILRSAHCCRVFER